MSDRSGPRAISRAHRIDEPADVIRPFLWLAVFCFAAGFSGWLALSPLLTPR
jgi:hypothetical protein